MIQWNHDMDAAPRDGTRLLLWCGFEASVGEWDYDMGGAWFAQAGRFTAHDGGECEVRLNPTAWAAITVPKQP